jgi:hypothetical protein
MLVETKTEPQHDAGSAPMAPAVKLMFNIVGLSKISQTVTVLVLPFSFILI